MDTDSIFNSTEAALTFAFNYARQQSPFNPMMKLVDQRRLGSGKNLVGLDGAAQAGLILCEISRLPETQKRVLTVRFGDARKDCPCCGQPTPTQEWQHAMAGLCGLPELEGYPRAVKRAMLEKIICRRKIDLKSVWRHYGVTSRSGYRRGENLKTRLGKAEHEALVKLETAFKQTGLIPEM